MAEEREASNDRGNPWWLLLTAGFVSAMLPVATLVHGIYQSRTEGIRKDRELELERVSREANLEKAWLEVAVDGDRPEAQRRQVLKFLAGKENEVGKWAKEALASVEQDIKVLEVKLEQTEAKLAEVEGQGEKRQAESRALTSQVGDLKARLGQGPRLPPPREIPLESIRPRESSEEIPVPGK